MSGRRAGFGCVFKHKDGRWLIQWTDAAGRRRWERLPDRSIDDKPLSERSIAQEGRRRLAQYQEQARRQRHGLEPMPSEALDLPFRRLYDFWWEHHGKTLKSEAAGPFTRKHLAPLWGVPLREVTTARLRRLLVDERERLRPKSLNHLRAFIHHMFKVASQPGGPWAGRPNPVADVPTFKVTPRPKAILEVHEFEAVLAQVDERWRGPVAVGLYAGLREGEIFGMHKQDVDLERGVILACRSWEAERTKDGKAMPVPIAPQLRPHLERALREAPGRLVFPAEGGTMHSRKLRLNRPLRAAIARAGLVVGYEHRCLAAGCGHVAPSQEPTTPERCPSCGRPTMWSKPIPRHVTFHGTRHSFGTAMVRAAGIAVAQKALRHSDVRLTIHTYGHLDDGDVREGVAAAFGAAAELRGPEAGAPSPGGPAPEAPATARLSVRTGARRGRSAASARTRCSSAA